MGFTENVSVFFEGDVAKAASYLSLAKQLTRDLNTQLSSVGLNSGHHIWPVDDTTTIHCRVTGGFLSAIIISEGCLIRMETGAVDRLTSGWGNPLINEPGIYRKPNWLPDSLNWKPSGAGVYTDTSTSGDPYGGTPNVDGATSRSIGFDPENEGTGSGPASKKLTMQVAPSSCYTGKMRLYVQAVYGRGLYEKRPEMMTVDTGAGPPQLWLTWKSKYPSPAVNTMYISTNSGMHRDALGNYWHLEVGPSSVRVTQMNHTPCSRALSDYLSSDEALALPTKEYDVIEAFILSALVPDEDITFTYTVPSMVGGNLSMGYGYHFNWDGDKADMIQTEYVWITGVQYKYRSKHYRLNFEFLLLEFSEEVTPLQAAQQSWRISQQVLSTTEWKCMKWYDVIAFPDWGQYQLEIFGALWGTIFGTNAPFYCFYNRNVLRTVTATSIPSGGTEYCVGSTPSYFYGGNYRCSTSPISACGAYYLCGLEGGHVESTTGTVNKRSITFTCGSVSITGSEDSYSGWMGDERQFGSGELGYRYPNTDVWGYGPIDVPIVYEPVLQSIGCATGSLTVAEITTVSLDYYIKQPQQIYWYQEYRSANFSHSETVKALTVIPFYDAEAVYLWGVKNESQTETATTKVTQRISNLWGGSNIGMYWYCPNGGGTCQRVDVESCDDYHALGGGWPSSSASSSQAQLGSYIVCNHGSYAVTGLPVTAGFFAGEPNTHVSQTFTTISAAVAHDVRTAGSTNFGSSGYTGDILNKAFSFVGGA